MALNQGMSFHTGIRMAKGALEGLIRTKAAEFELYIQVKVIAPSLLAIPLAATILGSEERHQGSYRRHPLDRIVRSDELDKMATFLLDSNLTGFPDRYSLYMKDCLP